MGPPRAGPPSPLETRSLTVCLNDATAGVFATPGEPSRRAWGRMQRSDQADQLLLNVCKPGVLAPAAPFPVRAPLQFMQVAAGAANDIWSGFRVPVKTSNPLEVDMHHVGSAVELSGRMTKRGEVALEIQVTLSWLPAGEESIPMNQVLESVPQIERVSTGKLAARLRHGEVFVVGGLVKQGKTPKTIKVPLLSELPVVGFWLSWTYTRDIEEELIVFVAPRIIRDK
jgi:hypothetical protein